MSIPDPLDEQPAGGVEIRGGDRDEDFMPGTQQLPFIPPLPGTVTTDCGCGDCGCEGG